MCCLVDAEGNGERGGFYLCRPLPEILIQKNVPVPGNGSIQESSQSGKISQRVHGRDCRGYFFQTGHTMKLDEKRLHLDNFWTRQWLVEVVDESRVG